MKIVIVIPVYKTCPDETEKMSLRQCLKVLSDYEICLICPYGLSTTVYDEVANGKMKTERFAQNYFENISGYNDLMKSHMFYERFKNYDYLLIYQLDAWVFRDELEEWCVRDYDYIGAPWFENWYSHEEGYDFMCVGNGGLSLRKVKKFLSITEPSMQRLRSYKQILDRNRGWCRYWQSIVQYFSRNNKVNVFAEQNKDRWEDVYFCYDLKASRLELRVPDCKEAAQFSMETSPKYIFNEVNKGHLPFGCHAWKKYQYEEFWKYYIKL